MTDSLAPGSMIAHYSRGFAAWGRAAWARCIWPTTRALGRRVALKVLPPDVAADPDRMHRFVQEAKLASALTHPNVAYIHEIGEDGDLWFLAMEYVEGVPLTQPDPGRPSDDFRDSPDRHPSGRRAGRRASRRASCIATSSRPT